MRHLLQKSSVVRRAVTIALLSACIAPLQADIVTLTGARSVRVAGVTTHGEATTLELVSGGTMTVPTASVQSVELEAISPELCSASPYRCQDRAMLLSRGAHAKSVATQLPRVTPAAVE